jgi:5-methylcytosine-specific restriction endonuclease McrA
MQPLARGGSNDASNLQLLCPRCNLGKGYKTMAEWAMLNHQPAPGDAS